MAIFQGLKSDVLPLLNFIFSIFLFVGTLVPQTAGNFIDCFIFLWSCVVQIFTLI